MNTQKDLLANGTSAKQAVKVRDTTHTTNLPPRRENEHAITIGLAPREVFAFWRDFSNLPKFMKDLSRVEILSAARSKWVIQLKSGLTAEWIAEITDEKTGEFITWQSVEGEIKTEGTVRFLPAPAGIGTVVTLAMDYEIPGGKLAELGALLSGESPEILILTNLKRLKGFLETGEIATTEGQPSGREPISETKTHSLH